MSARKAKEPREHGESPVEPSPPTAAKRTARGTAVRRKAANPKPSPKTKDTPAAPEKSVDTAPQAEASPSEHPLGAPRPAAAAETQVVPIDPTRLLKLVTFVLEGEEYGFPIMRVQEILRARAVHVTAIPNSPGYIEGVMNLRGRVIPVVGLRRRFGMPEVAPERSARVVVVEVGGRTIGVSVDAVREVVNIDSSLIEPLPDLAATGRSDFIVGVSRAGGRIVIVLDMERVFSPEEKAALGDLAAGNREGTSCE